MRLLIALVFLFVAGMRDEIAGPPPIVGKVDRVLVLKSERILRLLSDGRVVRQYNVALGANPVGHKEREGDERTPEGVYLLDWRNPKSSYHLSIHISYPNAEDRQRAAARGDDPGGLIMIHGQPNSLGSKVAIPASYDWTNGCIAVTNAEMDEIWNLVPDMTPIEIRP